MQEKAEEEPIPHKKKVGGRAGRKLRGANNPRIMGGRAGVKRSGFLLELNGVTGFFFTHVPSYF